MTDIAALDRADPLAAKRAEFLIPEGVIYLDGNSLGPLTKGAQARIASAVADEWGEMLIRGWNDAGWFTAPGRVGDRIGALIGAPPGSVTAADNTSINVFKCLSAALAMRPDRKVVLSDSGNFPTDLYIAEGLIAGLGGGHRLKTVAPEEVADALDEDVAVMMLTEVDYRTGRRHDMAGLTRRAHEVGALAMWDLAHSAGAFEVDLTGAGADFAVGCGYKYLNGGPGAPAFLYVRPERQARVRPLISGWMGHEAPFAFDPDYRPLEGIGRMRVGTPPVISLKGLDAALDVFDGVEMAAIRAKSISLSELFIAEVERRCAGHGLRLVSPRDPAVRGSQVSFAHEQGYAAMQALIARGVIGDFRAPDVMRFGFAPLYLSHADVAAAAGVLAEVLDGRLWDRPEYLTRSDVT
ncbi:kynureninase [Pikeienuella piscinae]|uniref:Kynureninase n=1 Tax=Pikeienuella piscinae TaxID=2748098 RepID=A0A7L5BY64_9RHOB|nr:kynureninase [Pikeienuella piscinae]QIE56865.1 kynureninase [Pikeienuella piscinae]